MHSIFTLVTLTMLVQHMHLSFANPLTLGFLLYSTGFTQYLSNTALNMAQ